METITIKNKGMRRVSVQSPHLPGGFLRIEAGETVTAVMEKGSSDLLASLSGKPGISIVKLQTEIPPVPMPAALPAEADENETDSDDDEV